MNLLTSVLATVKLVQEDRISTGKRANELLIVEYDFVFFGDNMLLISKTTPTEFHCKLDLLYRTHTHTNTHSAPYEASKVGLIYSSNQSHVEAVLPDVLAYFLSPRNVFFFLFFLFSIFF